jgi:DNA-binding HxlR family transcriptional regulator
LQFGINKVGLYQLCNLQNNTINSVELAQRMMTLTLRGLERDGLVTRTVFPMVPPKVQYELTRLGRSLLEPVGELGTWARKNRAAIGEARARFDAAG